MNTKDIFEQIIKQATKDDAPVFEKPFDSIKLQLRFYMEDIPDNPRYVYDSDAVFFYNCDEVICRLEETA